ncbi:ATP-binding protein [Thiotrichales bacterium HSG1]|nr:ATP-binding protein [Thiotrichales bacterium HSG1]
MSINPYAVGNAVGNSPAFVGREDILAEISNAIRSPYQNAVALFGNRRIGKSSVLRELEAKLPNEGNFTPIFFDLLDKTRLPLNEVIIDLAYKISFSLNIEEPNLGNEPSKKFQMWLSNKLKNISLVILFDEFDEFIESDTNNQYATNTLFPYLRDLLELNKQHLNFVFAIGRKISDLRTAQSLFKGILIQKISLLDQESTNKIIQFSEENKTLKWSNETKDAIWQETNGHPYIIQCLCYNIWNKFYSNDNIITINKVNIIDIIPKTLETASTAIEWLWQGLGAAERVVAAALAEIETKTITETQLENLLQESNVQIIIKEDLRTAAHILEEWDLIEPLENKGYRFRVEFIRKWIAENKPLSQVEREWEKIDQDAYRLYEAARNLYNVNEHEQALTFVRQAIKKNPDHLKANELLAVILIDLEKLEEAYELLKSLYKYHEKIAKPLLINTLFLLASKTRKIDKKISYYETILETDKNNEKSILNIKQLWEIQGNDAYRKGDLLNAELAYKNAGLDNKVAEINQKQGTVKGLEEFLTKIVEGSKGIEIIFVYDIEYKIIYKSNNGLNIDLKKFIKKIKFIKIKTFGNIKIFVSEYNDSQIYLSFDKEVIGLIGNITFRVDEIITFVRSYIKQSPIK